MKTFEETRTALEPIAKRYRHNTRLTASPGEVVLHLHSTPIVTVYPSGLIQLCTGGHETVTTKRRMNEALGSLGLTFHIVQENFEWSVWNWQSENSEEFLDCAFYRADGHAVPAPH